MKVHNFDETRPEDYEIIVYARKIGQPNSGYLAQMDSVEFELK